MSTLKACGHHYATEDEASRAKKVIAGTHLPSHCWIYPGWHLDKIVTQPAAKHRAVRDTGPSLKVRMLILARDGYRCCRCGKPCGPGIAQYSLQHRVARGAGGTSDPRANSPERLLLACGSATTGCHGEIEKRGREDNGRGYWLHSWEDPATVPVMYFEEGGGGFTAWLCLDGSLSFEPPAERAS